MSRKRSRSKENGFLAIPYSSNKLLGHNTRIYLKIVDQVSWQGAVRRKTQHTRLYVSILSRFAAPPWGIRRIFEIASIIEIARVIRAL